MVPTFTKETANVFAPKSLNQFNFLKSIGVNLLGKRNMIRKRKTEEEFSFIFFSPTTNMADVSLGVFLYKNSRRFNTKNRCPHDISSPAAINMEIKPKKRKRYPVSTTSFLESHKLNMGIGRVTNMRIALWRFPIPTGPSYLGRNITSKIKYRPKP